jgi:hypothetical protein
MRTIPLTQGYEAIVDDDDFERVSRHKWIAWTKERNGKKQVYAVRTFRRPNKLQRTVQLHRFIVDEWNPDVLVDHANRNPLDCRRDNLRRCNDSQNLQNSTKRSGVTSKYKGVHWYPKYGKWAARIQHNKKRMSLGYFEREVDAAAAYNLKAKELFGEFAVLNEVPQSA